MRNVLHQNFKLLTENLDAELIWRSLNYAATFIHHAHLYDLMMTFVAEERS